MAARLADVLEQDVRDFLLASDQSLGDIEVQLEQQSRELLRVATEKAAQKKADVTPPVCPVCKQGLSRLTDDHRRSFECRFGTITIGRSRATANGAESGVFRPTPCWVWRRRRVIRRGCRK
jgi:hypothetical protein